LEGGPLFFLASIINGLAAVAIVVAVLFFGGRAILGRFVTVGEKEAGEEAQE
jgi:hypothetical protein